MSRDQWELKNGILNNHKVIFDKVKSMSTGPQGEMAQGRTKCSEFWITCEYIQLIAPPFFFFFLVDAN